MTKTYEDGYKQGLEAGKIAALHKRVDGHDIVLENHEKKVSHLQKLIWLGMGILIGTVKFIPSLELFVQRFIN